MMLALILAATALLGVTAIGVLLAIRSDRVALGIGTLGSAGACILGAAAAVVALWRGERTVLRGSWSMPIGEPHVALDPLSAFFLVCVFVVSGLAAVYGKGYLQGHLGKRRLAPAIAFFNLLVASMAGLVIARDGVVFLIAWEVMSLASFFLVTFEDDREDVRRAGMTYLVASHLGVVFLLALFVLFASGTGSFDFDAFVSAGRPGWTGNACFLLALVGFGAKAGFWPTHVWLPDAHPAAPSHVSAVMSGVMIKMGIYGLLRILTFWGEPPVWWGLVLVVIGVVSGVTGVLHALAQHDLKRLLAYHSVENVGIIAMGLGLGLVGQSLGNPVVAFLGFSGGLLHVLNHGLFKGLLFQGAGSIARATGTRELDCLGGLHRHMPQTAITFLVGAVAIAGLPPLNGFVSEWLIYVGAFRGAATFPTGAAVVALFTVAALALIGGLAAACFVKAFGVVFLGVPRSPTKITSSDPGSRHEAPASMIGAMWAGAVLCAGIGLAAVLAVKLVAPATCMLAGLSFAPLEGVGALQGVVHAAAALVVVTALLVLLRRLLLRGREVTHAPTWGCGYPDPTPRMQYTAASFAEPVLAPFSVVFARRSCGEPPSGPFPRHAAHHEHLEDRAARVLVPAVQRVTAKLAGIGRWQGGGVQLYLTYVLATLVVLLGWQAIWGTPKTAIVTTSAARLRRAERVAALHQAGDRPGDDAPRFPSSDREDPSEVSSDGGRRG
ncbi:MAG: proton-conducting transporter membrane subunit, partial [Pseudomonadota bacterium]